MKVQLTVCCLSEINSIHAIMWREDKDEIATKKRINKLP